MRARTLWAEEFVDHFISLPLVREWVFKAPSRIDRGREREVCDLLVSLRSDALLIQMKCQEDPRAFVNDAKRERWIRKHAAAAASQVKGAVRNVRIADTWCNHPRRGRVCFSAGDLSPLAGIVLVENWGPRITLPGDLPISHDGVPIAYFSVNDFQNVISELRAFPEIAAYLQARCSLPQEAIAAIGGENVIFLYYLLHGRTFDDWTNFEEAQRASDLVIDPESILRAARSGEGGARLLEMVADALATRADDYLHGLPSELAEGFDPPPQRRNYLRMQENICDLNLDARKLLGMKLWELIDALAADRKGAMTFATAYVDQKPEFLYVLASANGLDRATLLTRGIHALWAGLPHYEKKAGMFIADRDGQGFEVVYMSRSIVTNEARDAGRRMFGHLKMFSL